MTPSTHDKKSQFCTWVKLCSSDMISLLNHDISYLTINNKDSFKSNLILNHSWQHTKVFSPSTPSTFFCKSFIAFCIHMIHPLIFSIWKQLAPGQSYYHNFFFNKNICILYTFSHWQQISYLLYRLKCFIFSSFHYIFQFLTHKNLNKAKKQVIELLYQHLLIGKLKNIFRNL